MSFARSPKLAESPQGRNALGDRIGPVDYLLIFVATGHWPFSVMARNVWQLVHPERVLILVLLASLVVWFLARMLVKLGSSRWASLLTSIVVIICFTRGGAVIREIGVIGWALFLLVITAVWFLGRRLDGESILKVLTVALVVAVGSGPVFQAYNGLTGLGAAATESTEIEEIRLLDKPDIYLVVIDGYPGRTSMNQELGVSPSRVTNGLESVGFQLPDSAWSPYWSTHLAVSSILNMGYPIRKGDVSNATVRDLHSIIGGENRLVSLLRDNGYSSTMIESGWVGSSCGDDFDRCVPSPWLDDLMFFILKESVIGRPLLEANGHAYTIGTKASMKTLVRIAEKSGETIEPRFVFAHLLAPHPPFFFDNDCETVIEPERVGDSFFIAGVDRLDRERFFLEQASCVDEFMMRFAEVVAPSDVVLYVADHGTDRRKESLDQGQRHREAIVERMNVFVAARVKQECELGDQLVTANLLRRTLSCYSQDDIPDLPERMYLPGIYEMTDHELTELFENLPG